MSPADRRKAWVRGFVRRVPDVPLYGSEDWLAMPEGLGKWVSVLRYAEAARTELEDSLARLRQGHLDAALLAGKRAEDFEFVARRDDHRREWTGRGFRPDPAIAADVQHEWREWVSA